MASLWRILGGVLMIGGVASSPGSEERSASGPPCRGSTGAVLPSRGQIVQPPSMTTAWPVV